MAIYIVGDIHGGAEQKKLYSKYFPNYKDCTKEDVIIQLGDFGYIWDIDKTKRETRINSMKQVFENRKWGKTLVTMGNHENYDLLEKYPVEDLFGGKVRRLSDTIYEMLRGEIYIIDGYKILSCGGSSSVDKEYLCSGIDWFEQESLSNKDIENCLENLEKHNFKVDLIVSHTCSASTLKQVCKIFNMHLEELDSHNYFFEELKQKVEYSHWFFGHLHKDLEINDKETVVFNKIWRLDDIFKKSKGITSE